jgi:hypothetical protein
MSGEKMWTEYDKKARDILENLAKDLIANHDEHFPGNHDQFVPVNREVFEFMWKLHMIDVQTQEQWVASLMEVCTKKFGRNSVVLVEKNGEKMLKFAKQDNGAERKTTEEAAVYLGLTREQLRRRTHPRFTKTQIKNGQTPIKFHGFGRAKYFLKSELDAADKPPEPSVAEVTVVKTAAAAREVANLKGKKRR